MGASILNDGGNFRTMALGETMHVIVYGPICLSVNFLNGQLIFRFLVLSHDKISTKEDFVVFAEEQGQNLMKVTKTELNTSGVRSHIRILLTTQPN